MSRARAALVALVALGLAACGVPEARAPESRAPAAEHAAPARDLVAVATLLETRGEGTYVAELLDLRDGWNYRWRERRTDPIRVWIERSANPAYGFDYEIEVQRAFGDWVAVGLPLRFAFVADSSRAEVHVTWVDRFTERMTGRTLWRHDADGWMSGGHILLALHLPDGRRVTGEGVRAVALHEIGHLIGLDHPRDETSVMSAQVYVTQLNEADRRTARLVYDLPAGRLWP